MKRKNEYCYFNGSIIILSKAKISPYDIGLLRGYGVFDVMCTQNGKPFLLDEHWKRLQNSAKELHLNIPIAEKKFKEVVCELLKKNGYKKSTVRTVLTGGVSSDGFNFEGNPNFFILVENFGALHNDHFEKGANVITIEHKRDVPHAKITNYLRAIQKQKEKAKKKAVEIVYTDKKYALEASTSNFFIVKGGKIITAHEDILHGVTRNLVAKLARKSGLKIVERKIKVLEMMEADEMFLTASNKDIVPVVKVNGKKIGSGKPGEVTKKLMKLFADFVKNY